MDQSSQAFAPVDAYSHTPHRDRMISALENDLKSHGLMLRGGFYPSDNDSIPGDVRTLIMVGNAGSDMWSAFSRSEQISPNPLDTWTSQVIDPIADVHGARAIYPFSGPPYHPFQSWAQLADDVYPSQIGPLIHPKYGLWHAYRAALLFSDELPLPSLTRTASPCDACDDKPCLIACPVEALSVGAYDVPRCRTHIASDRGIDCIEAGCRARRACPIGQDFVYEPTQAEFHMQSFLDA